MSPRARTLAVLSVAFCLAWPLQGGGGVQNAHYALTKALAGGTPQIDSVLDELGDFGTFDYVVVSGHTYANKAPGFAMLGVAPYVALRAAGVRTTGDPARMLWALGLVLVVLPAVCLLVLVRDRADVAAEGLGTVAAVMLGLGTFVFPYAGVFLPHILATTLLFAAFALLWRSRAGPPGTLPALAAGALCGYGVATEYPIAIGAAVLLAYSAAGPESIRRVAAFAAGGVVGVTPLLLYNAWAFDDPFFVSYSGGAEVGSLFGAPSIRVAVALLLSANGLLVLSPVLACAVIGVPRLYRAGFRAEVAAIGAVTAAYIAFTSAYVAPFGGIGPGSRFLIVTLPFLAIALASAVRARPVTCGALGLVSALLMALMTSTHALAAADGRWLERLGDRELTPAVPSLIGITGWYGWLPFALALAVAGVAAVASARGSVAVGSWDALLAGAAVGAWALVAASAPRGEAATLYRNYAVAAAVVAAFAVLPVVSGFRRSALSPG